MNLSESYKNRIKKLAGLLNEEMTIGRNGDLTGIAPPGQIPGDKEFLYSVTFQTTTPESLDNGGDYDSQGYEEDETRSTLENIIDLAKHKYGVSKPSSTSHHGNGIEPSYHGGIWWSSVDAESSRDFYEKGINKYYSLHIKNIDGKELNAEDSTFITKLLKSNERWGWDDIDNMWVKK